MNKTRLLTGGLFVFFLFATPLDILTLVEEGTLSFFVDFGQYSFLILVFDFALLFSTYHDTWVRKR